MPSFATLRPLVLALAATSIPPRASPARAADPVRDLQDAYAAGKDEPADRAYHFGSQGRGGVFSNHTGHSNRLIPAYAFGRRVDLGAVLGPASRYRDPARIQALYGTLPAHTANPDAAYADQSDLHRVQREAVARGVKYLFTVWFDGLDWETTRAAAIAKTGRVYAEGKGAGLVFQEESAAGSAQFGFVVTSPTHDKNRVDLDAQTVTIPAESLGGGYDARIAGPDPWTLGPLGARAPGYLKGQAANADDKAGVAAVGGVLHACTDSSQSAGEYATGVKSYNNGVNVADDGRFVPTLFGALQAQGWKVGTATSVPFDHVSPAAMYAHNVHRDDYQDLARDMLGLRGIGQETGQDELHPGLDVVLGAGHGQEAGAEALRKSQGRNAQAGNLYITAADRAAVDVAHGGRYVVVGTAAGVRGATAVQAAAERAARDGHRLFGVFGTRTYGKTASHLPYRTADGDYHPAAGVKEEAEVYAAADLEENPTLADLTRAALTVLAAEPGRPFALFVEAGDVDFALHDNNLDNAIGAVHSGEAAVRAILDWVETHSNWDESALIVTADHGHYLVLDDPGALAPKAP
ncbi:MAG TPA: alkaline phosphatase [Isosphaeraceae bacterium]